MCASYFSKNGGYGQSHTTSVKAVQAERCISVYLTHFVDTSNQMS